MAQQILSTNYQEEGQPYHGDSVNIELYTDVITGLKLLELYHSYFQIFTSNAVTDEALRCLEKVSLYILAVSVVSCIVLF